AADDAVADLPAGDAVGHGHDRPRVLVPAGGADLAPPLHHHVQVAAAHAAVADLEEDLTGTGLGHGQALDGDRAVALVDGGGHGLRGVHAGVDGTMTPLSGTELRYDRLTVRVAPSTASLA